MSGFLLATTAAASTSANTSSLVVSNAAALAALSGSWATGATIYVQSFHDTFTFAANSALTVDNVKVISATGATGQWIRNNIPSPYWTSTSSWYIDPSSGNDENNGSSSGTAVKTFAELRRRFGQNPEIKSSTTINILGNLTEDISWEPILPNQNTILTITGQRTVLKSGTFGTVTARSVNQALEVSGTSGIDGYVGSMIVHVSTGATAYVIKSLGANSARLTPFINVTALPFTVSEVVPVNGDAFQIVSLTTTTGAFSILSPGIRTYVTNQSSIVIKNLSITASSGTLTELTGNSTYIAVKDCIFNGLINSFHQNSFLYNVLFNSSINAYFYNGDSGIIVYGGGSLSTMNIFGGSSAGLIFRLGTLLQGASLYVRGNGQCDDLMIKDWSGSAIKLDYNSYFQIFGLTGNTSTASTVVFEIINGTLRSGYTSWSTPTKITDITGGATFKLAGQTSGPAFDVTGGTFSANRSYTVALLDTTYAGGGFGGSAKSYFGQAQMTND